MDLARVGEGDARPPRTYTFYAAASDAPEVRVAFSRPFFECLGVEVTDAYVAHADPTFSEPVFVHERSIERRMCADRASEVDAIVAMAVVPPPSSSRSAPIGGGIGRFCNVPFPLEGLRFELTGAGGAAIAPSRAVLCVRIVYYR